MAGYDRRNDERMKKVGKGSKGALKLFSIEGVLD